MLMICFWYEGRSGPLAFNVFFIVAAKAVNLMFNCELMAGIIAISATLFRVAFEIVEKLDGVLGSLLLRK